MRNGFQRPGSDYDDQVMEGRTAGTAENSLMRPKEIGFDNTGESDASEAVVIDLENFAMSMTLSLQHFYKGVEWENDELGLIMFYKLVNGEYVQVHSETFDAYSSNGNYTGTLPDGYDGTFDRVVIAGVQGRPVPAGVQGRAPLAARPPRAGYSISRNASIRTLSCSASVSE